MIEHRSGSQILFGFLPEQTVDLGGRVWKVREWVNPIHTAVDLDTLRRELLRNIAPWSATGQDGAYAQDLFENREVQVHSLNHDNGVAVDPYPQVWKCKRCDRVSNSELRPCVCGSRRWGQLPFVGYHAECGAIRAPYIRPCPEHNDVRVRLPGTASASEIRFECPVCSRLLRQGFGFPRCQCGAGAFTFNVHRAASVYTPRTIVIVNPPSPEQIRRVTNAGGPSRALSWVVSGMETRSMEDSGLTKQALIQQLMQGGISLPIAETMAEQAEQGGQLVASSPIHLAGDDRDAAESEATRIALAVTESRLTVADLAAGTTGNATLAELYGATYPASIARAGLSAVELVDKFPVLTGVYGFTRGDSTPGASRLVPFRDARNRYIVYADRAETEALLIRLDPERVAAWLRARGFALNDWTDARTARIAILQAARVPDPGTTIANPTCGSVLLSLVHSYAHLFIRRAAVFAGIDRNALSELLVPLHLGFFVYAAARGDFTLGGLQAVFETELDTLLASVATSDFRCPLDPGCRRTAGACMACLHIGEPSCRYYNSFLDRSVLSGASGYLRPTFANT